MYSKGDIPMQPLFVQKTQRCVSIKDIEGCILVGSEFGELNGVPAVLESRKAFNRLQSSVGEESFELVIT